MKPQEGMVLALAWTLARLGVVFSFHLART